MMPLRPRRAQLLRPRLVQDVIPRRRLLDCLAAGLDRPLTLIAAPAGYGKTTLLCQWLDSLPARAAWLSLDLYDSDLVTFVTAMVSALQSLWPDVGRTVLDLLQLPFTPPPDYLAATLADSLFDLPELTILVLDDYQVINDPAVHAFLAALLGHPAQGFHVALATRVEPPLPLPLLRAREQLVELRGSDLAFSPTEAHAFLTFAAGASVSAESAALLEQQTEGWVTGLRLAALSMRAEGDATWLTRGVTRRHALDFLLDEVLAPLPAALQNFLLRTAVVERVCGPLCEVLLDPPPPPGDGAATLRQLVRAELFVIDLGEDEEGRQWVRYHPLFRELLRERLVEREGPMVVAALHRRAADWLAAHDLVAEALETLLSGGEAEAAGRLVEERLMTMTEADDWHELWGWLRQLPETLVRRRPGLLLAHTYIDQWRGRTGAMVERLQAATALLDATESTFSAAELAILRAQADEQIGVLALYRGDSAEVVKAAQRALPHFPDPHTYLGGCARMFLGLGLHQMGCHDEAMRILLADGDITAPAAPSPRAIFALAIIHLMNGDHPAARQFATRLLVQAERHDLPLLHSWAHYLLGRVAYELNELAEARVQFAGAIEERRVNFFCTSEALLGLALTEQALGETASSEQLLGAFLTLLAETGNDEARPRINAFQARLALQRGDTEAAIAWLERVGPETTDSPGLSDILIYMVCPTLTRARILLARGRPNDIMLAAELVTAFRARAEREHATGWRIHALAVQALVENARGDIVAALDHLTTALDLAEPGGFLRAFLDLGPPLAALLRALAERRQRTPNLARVLAAMDAAPAAVRAPQPRRLAASDPALRLLGELTDREAQVLELLARRLTNKEIAAELSISPLTVKRHVSGILGKMQVRTRRQAMLQATALGIVSRVRD